MVQCSATTPSLSVALHGSMALENCRAKERWGILPLSFTLCRYLRKMRHFLGKSLIWGMALAVGNL